MKIALENISFLEYVEKGFDSRYDYALLFGNFEPLDLFSLGDLTNHTFGFVKDIQEILNYEGLTWDRLFDEMSKFLKVDKKSLYQYKFFDLFRFKLFLKKEVEKINELESKAFGHETTIIESEAGIDEFAKYRSFIQLDKLANGDILKYDEIRKQPYFICFTKLKLESDRVEFDKRFAKLSSKI